MKKIFRILIISALLVGIFIPVFDYYFNVERPAQSVRISQKSRNRNIKELNKLAQEAFYDGNYKGAVSYYQKIIKNKPFDIQSRRNLAFIYNELGQLEAENRILLQISILSSEQSDYLNLAANFYELNNNLASNFILEKKINKNLDNDNFLYKKYYYLIKNNLDLNQLDQAEKYLMKITNLKMNKATIYLLSAELNKKKENFELAYKDYYDSYKANRSQSFLYKNMAEMLEKAGREIDAYNHWQKTLAYGWFKDLAYQKINYYQNKYPRLKEDAKKEKEKPEEINPFDLKASWENIREIKNKNKEELLRIGLEENNKRLLFQYSGPFSIIQDGKIIFKGREKENYLLEIENSSIYIKSRDNSTKLGSSSSEYEFYSSSADNGFYVFNINYGQGYFWQGSANRQYRGQMLIKGEKDNFTLINKVELTPYLFSVVPSEIYASWPVEALKAQAVAARSYTLNNLGRHSSDGYDLCSSVHCAAYNGIGSENERTSRAVLATQGESAYYDGKVIEAVFSSNSGGFTERSDQIWSADLPYLRGSNQMKDNDYNFPLEPLKLKNWIFNSPASYSKDFGSSNYRWQLNIPAEVIEYRSEISPIKNIEVLKRSKGGTITSLKISGEDNEKTYSVSQVRRVLGGLKSSRFYYESHYDKNDNLNALYIYGSGWGHNLGLDQSASAGMGKAGFDYKEIIKHFYPGVEIKNNYR